MKSTISKLFYAATALFMFAAAASVTSCKEEETVIPVEPLEFGIAPQMRELSFMAARPEAYTYEVTTNRETWAVKADADWCTVDTSGNTFTVKPSPNFSFDERSGATVTVMVEDSVVFEIAVSQKPLEVYAAGSYNNASAYWRNQELVDMSVVTGGTSLNDIYVTRSGDVHLTGYGIMGFNTTGFYWSEAMGLFTTNRREGGSGSAFSVFVDEETSTVYFTTHEGWTNEDWSQTYQACLWTNFEPEDEPESMSAGDVIVDNGNVYVLYDGFYTVNGEKVNLEEIKDGNYVSCMEIHDGDVYVGGYYLDYDKFCPAYWVNGKANPIPTTISSQVYSISIDSNGDVYLGGSEGLGLDRCAAYWKNGEMTAVTEYANACIGEIFALDGQLAILYFEENAAGNTAVKCSLDGNVVEISDGAAPAYVQAGFIL